MADLITTTYAKNALQADTSFSAADDAVIAALVTAVSDAVRAFCRRRFDSQSFDHLCDGGGDSLLLREYPVQSIQSIRSNPASVLEVSNTLISTNQQATVEVRSTGLALVRAASGVSSTDTSVTFATYPTIEGCAAAIRALGNGWTARSVGSATGDYGLWPSADLHVSPWLGDGTRSMGALDCRGRYAPLRMHVDWLSDYSWDASGLIQRAAALPWPEGLGAWDLADRAFPGGAGWFRVKYTAGYTTVPESVQAACAEWVRQLYFAWKRDAAVVSEINQSATSYTYRGLSRDMPDLVPRLLAPFVKRSV